MDERGNKKWRRREKGRTEREAAVPVWDVSFVFFFHPSLASFLSICLFYHPSTLFSHHTVVFFLIYSPVIPLIPLFPIDLPQHFPIFLSLFKSQIYSFKYHIATSLQAQATHSLVHTLNGCWQCCWLIVWQPISPQASSYSPLREALEGNLKTILVGVQSVSHSEYETAFSFLWLCKYTTCGQLRDIFLYLMMGFCKR